MHEYETEHGNLMIV